MKMIKIIFIVVLALAQVKKAVSENVDLDFSEASDAFAFDAYAKATAGRTGSLIMSPASIQRILTMASFGAVGKTKNEILAGLKYPEDLTRDDLARNSETLTANVKQSAYLKMATKIFYKQSISIKPAFNDVAKKSFGSETQAIDFIRNQEAAKIINGWVESQTNGKIKNMFSPGDFNSDTRVALVNAIYFLGNWEVPFNPNKTKKETFYNSGVTAVTVDMMNIKDYYKYCELPSLNATALQMPYKDSDISMLLILPNSNTGLKFMEENLRTTTLDEILKDMETIEVNVKLPKFKIETEMVLDNILQAMGMETMFTEKADFSGMISGNESISISKTIHKAMIQVNELGTEAAAATGVIVAGSGPKVTYFYANHPFMFAITNNDGIYFIGRVDKF